MENVLKNQELLRKFFPNIKFCDFAMWFFEGQVFIKYYSYGNAIIYLKNTA